MPLMGLNQHNIYGKQIRGTLIFFKYKPLDPAIPLFQRDPADMLMKAPKDISSRMFFAALLQTNKVETT